MSFRFAGYAVQVIHPPNWIRVTMLERRHHKRRANKCYRRMFKEQVVSGLEAPSEFNPKRNCFLTIYDLW